MERITGCNLVSLSKLLFSVLQSKTCIFSPYPERLRHGRGGYKFPKDLTLHPGIFSGYLIISHEVCPSI